MAAVAFAGLPGGAQAKQPEPLSCSQAESWTETGMASWYGKRDGIFEGKTTASGETFDNDSMTAAHPRLPFGTRVKVTNLRNGRSATLVINDRGPFVGGRVIDVSRAGASELGFRQKGTSRVKVEVLETC